MTTPINFKQAKANLEEVRYQVAHEDRNPQDLVHAQAHHDDFLSIIRENIEAIQLKVADATDMRDKAQESDPALAKLIQGHIENLKEDLDNEFAKLAA